jgi:hypothetical protein
VPPCGRVKDSESLILSTKSRCGELLHLGVHDRGARVGIDDAPRFGPDFAFR